jgi:hypothetical protein
MEELLPMEAFRQRSIYAIWWPITFKVLLDSFTNQSCRTDSIIEGSINCKAGYNTTIG